jgi:N-acetyl-anhydromuramyl-L-alanine amidase AmpD
MGEILICGNRYPINRRVSNFADGGFSFVDVVGIDGEPLLRDRRGHPQAVSELAEVVNKIVIHHDGCADSKTCFQVLVDRGLSTHFMIARDGLIHQVADPCLAAIHAGSVNAASIGIDLSNPADNLLQTPDAPVPDGAAPSGTVKINGVDFSSWTYSDAQYESLNELLGLLSQTLDLETDMPVGPDGGLLLDALEPEAAKAFKGILCHWHIDVEKWDPGPGFDFTQVRPPMAWQGAACPVAPALESEAGAAFAVGCPLDSEICAKMKQADPVEAGYLFHAFCDAVDNSIDGGWFPVGVNGNWHGGIHIPCHTGAQVRPVAAGEIVAASFGSDGDDRLGSSGFVLIKHTHAALPGAKTWYSLYMHLQRPAVSAFDHHPLVKLLAKSQVAQPRRKFTVPGLRGVLPVPLDPSMYPDQCAAMKAGWVGLFPGPDSSSVRVSPRDVIGFVAAAGAVHGQADAVLHFEVFRNPDDSDVAGLQVGSCPVSGDFSGLIVDRSPDLMPDLDAHPAIRRLVGDLDSGDGHAGAAKSFRAVSVLHMSEWSPQIDWLAAMQKSNVLQKMRLSRAEEGAFVGYLSSYARFAWLSPSVSEHAGINTDGLIVSVHPLWFMFACSRVTLPGDLWKGRDEALKSKFRGRRLIDRILDVWSM